MKIDITKIQPYIDDKMISVQRHPDLPLSIYNYTQKCQFAKKWDEITKMCRGLIVNDEGIVIARPFDKFFNLGEKEALTVPEGEKFTAFDKADGSLGIMYPTTSSVALATRGSFLSDQSQVGTKLLRKAMEKISASIFKPNEITYLFEIIYPENRIVLDYHGESKLIFLGARDIESGKIYTPDFFPEICHYFESADTIIDYKTPRENAEGVVLHFYPSDFMVKVKYDEYVRLHRLVTGVNARRVWELLKEAKIEMMGTYEPAIKDLVERVPEEFSSWVRTTADNLVGEFVFVEGICADIVEKARKLETRKEQADLVFKSSKGEKRMGVSGICFIMLDKKPYVDAIWKLIKPEHETPFKREVQ